MQGLILDTYLIQRKYLKNIPKKLLHLRKSGLSKYL